MVVRNGRYGLFMVVLDIRTAKEQGILMIFIKRKEFQI